MPDLRGGLHRFRERLHPEVARDLLAWSEHPELSKLLAALEAHTDEHTFLNTAAEAIVARRLLAGGCDLRFEVPTPSGRQCDFEVSRGGARFYLHVKRAETGEPAAHRLTVSSRLRVLERIARPYVVSIRWHEGLTSTQMQHLVTRGGEFVLQARVGDELAVHDPDTGREIGGLRILAPGAGSHVTLVIGLPSGFVDEAPRLRRLLARAYKQFMPRAANVVLVGSSDPRDAEQFEVALLGSHIERWDAFPPRGQRIAHGRDIDGFWHGGRYEQSRAAGWFHFALNQPHLATRLWLRETPPLADEPARKLLADLLAQPHSAEPVAETTQSSAVPRAGNTPNEP